MSDARQGVPARAEDGARRYTIKPEMTNRYLAIYLPQRWTESLLTQYLSDLRSWTGVMMRHGGYRGALVDVSDFGIQPQAIAAAHGSAMWRARAMYGVKAAMFAIGERPKLQIKRMADEAGQRSFDCRAEALDWLIG